MGIKGLVKILFFSIAILSYYPAFAAPEDARFKGGSFDGWSVFEHDIDFLLDIGLITISSASAQTFEITQKYTLADITITTEAPADTFVQGQIMRLSIPSTWRCCFDPNAEITLTGNALTKIDTPEYIEADRTLKIPLLEKLITGDTIVVSGLQLLNLHYVPVQQTAALEFDFNGDGLKDIYDKHFITLTHFVRGGSYDGWNYFETDETSLMPEDVIGTIFELR